MENHLTEFENLDYKKNPAADRTVAVEANESLFH
jgi:hypothetical protein